MSATDFSTLFELLPIGAYRSTIDGKLLRANAAMVRLSGFGSEDAMKHAINDFATDWYVLPGRRLEFKARVRARGEVTDFVSEVLRHGSRERIWVREHAHSVRDEKGAIQFFEGTVEDITQAQKLHIQMRENAEVFKNLMHTIPDMVWLKDAKGIYRACNSEFEHLFGETAQNIIGKTDQDFADNEMARKLASTDHIPLRSGRPASFEEELITAKGAASGTFEILKTPMHNDLGQITGVLGMGRDITSKKHAENLRRDTSEQFELAIIGAELGVWSQVLTSPQAFDMDARAAALLGLKLPLPRTNRNWADLVHPDDVPVALNEMTMHLDGQTPFFEAEYRAKHVDGRWIWLSSRGKIVQTSPTGEPTRVVGTLMDITARKQAEETIRHMAFQDALTGLPNRRLLMDRLHQALAASVRHKRCGALLFLDLDKFKHLNDTQGHDVGDLLLQQVSERILKSVRAVDTVARIGGDEFVVLIADLSESPEYAQAHAAKVGEKILAALNQPYDLGDHQHISTPSIGATLFTGHALTPSAVLKQADQAMYEAKARGRNNLQFYEEVIGLGK
jgi:diguanylate cyclase (GGDEF)-like protein/PAS domain S-box-containing protein